MPLDFFEYSFINLKYFSENSHRLIKKYIIYYYFLSQRYFDITSLMSLLLNFRCSIIIGWDKYSSNYDLWMNKAETTGTMAQQKILDRKTEWNFRWFDPQRGNFIVLVNSPKASSTLVVACQALRPVLKAFFLFYISLSLSLSLSLSRSLSQ